MPKELLANALDSARQLLGYKLIHESDQGVTSGLIVETEAYSSDDPASHTFRGQTERNKVMFGPAGYAYVYFTYGMHYCFNVVTGAAGHGQAVLIRALEPVEGIELMFKRRFPQLAHMDAVQGSNEQRASRTGEYGERTAEEADAVKRHEPAGATGFAGWQGKAVRELCNGPAKLVQAMGITKADYGAYLLGRGKLRLEPGTKPGKIVQTTRIGIKNAVNHPWRFYIADNPYISKS